MEDDAGPAGAEDDLHLTGGGFDGSIWWMAVRAAFAGEVLGDCDLEEVRMVMPAHAGGSAGGRAEPSRVRARPWR